MDDPLLQNIQWSEALQAKVSSLQIIHERTTRALERSALWNETHCSQCVKAGLKFCFQVCVHQQQWLGEGTLLFHLCTSTMAVYGRVAKSPHIVLRCHLLLLLTKPSLKPPLNKFFLCLFDIHWNGILGLFKPTYRKYLSLKFFYIIWN